MKTQSKFHNCKHSWIKKVAYSTWGAIDPMWQCLYCGKMTFEEPK